MTRTEALQQRKELLKLIDQWTGAEIMSRLGRFNNLEYADFHKTMLEKRDEIRHLVYGESELVKLGEMFGMLKKSKGQLRNKK